MIFEAVTVGTVISDASQIILEVDDAYAETVGWDRRDLIGRKALSFTYRDDAAHNQPLLDALTTGGRGFAITKRYVRANGSVAWVENHVSAAPSINGEARFLATCRPSVRPFGFAALANSARTVDALRTGLALGKQLFTSDIVNNPAAELLLLLFQAEIEGRSCDMEYLAQQTGVTVASAERWIKLLIERGLADFETACTGCPPAVRISQHAERQVDTLLTTLAINAPRDRAG